MQAVSKGAQKVKRNKLGLIGKGKGHATGPKGEMGPVRFEPWVGSRRTEPVRMSI